MLLRSNFSPFSTLCENFMLDNGIDHILLHLLELDFLAIPQNPRERSFATVLSYYEVSITWLTSSPHPNPSLLPGVFQSMG
mmetsp:Transcript_7406/g.15117  ORF Transcript_7406/g.15117 Transcript_7406/m.15117 type:complete len:81 (+) Transcript_7406:1341-1583(+)